MAHKAHRRPAARQLHGEYHAGISRLEQREALGVAHLGNDHGERLAVRPHDLHRVARAELIAQAERRHAVRVAALNHRHDLPVADVAGIVVILPRLTVIKAGRIVAVTDVLDLVEPDRVGRLPRRDLVEHMAVGPRDDGGVVFALRAALNLDAVDARVHDVVQMTDHAHIAGVHDVRSLLVLKDGEVFARPFLLHQGVLIAAGLGAGAAVAVAPRHVV